MATTIRLPCSKCRHVQELDSSLAGKSFSCRVCGQVLLVPTPKGSEARPGELLAPGGAEGKAVMGELLPSTATAPARLAGHPADLQPQTMPFGSQPAPTDGPSTGRFAAGIVSLIFGTLSVICMVLGCVTCGFTYWAAVPLALIGGLVGSFGQGATRVGGLILNILALIPAVVLLLMFTGVLGLGIGSSLVAPETSKPSSQMAEPPPPPPPPPPTPAQLVERHRRTLQGTDRQARLQAITALGDLGADAADAVPDIADVIREKDEALRLAAMEALGKLGPVAKPGLYALLNALLDPSETIQQAALRALPKVGSPTKKELPTLKMALNVENVQVRLYALNELANVGLTPDELVSLYVASLDDPKPEVRSAAIGALGKLGPKAKDAVPTLVTMLGKTKETTIRTGIVTTLGEIGPAAKPAQAMLLEELKSPEVVYRKTVAQALLRIGPDGNSTRVWLAALKDKEIADVAAKALAMIGKTAVPGLTAALGDKDAFIRTSAAEALGRIGPDANGAAAPLIDALKDGDGNVRDQAARALLAIKPKPDGVVVRLGALLKDKSDQTRSAAVRLLGKLGWDGKIALPLLTEALKDKTADVRAAAAAGVGEFGAEGKGAVPGLVALLKDGDNDVRDTAIASVGKIGPAAKDAVPALVLLLSHPDKVVRPKAVEALVGIDPTASTAAAALDIVVKFAPFTDATEKEAVRAFNALEDDERVKAFPFLGKLGALGMPFLTAGLKDRDASVQAAAIQALGVPELIKLLDNKEVLVRTEAAKALGASGPAAKDAVGALATAMRDRFPTVRAAADHAMVRIGKPAVAELVRHLASKDASLRTRSIRVLGQIGPDAREAVPALTKASKDPSATIALEAQDALRKIKNK